jgi:hypothetical protein
MGNYLALSAILITPQGSLFFLIHPYTCKRKWDRPQEPMPDKLQLVIKLGEDGANRGFAGASNMRPLAANWHLTESGVATEDPGEAWDVAYEAAAKTNVFAEPNFRQPWRESRAGQPTLAARPGETGSYDDQNPTFPMGPGFGWHLGERYTQLAKARTEIENLGDRRSSVRIGIIDVGFDFEHQALPKPPLLRQDLQRNFSDGNPNDASDPYVEGWLKQDQPGHGTGTLSILAGVKLANMLRPEQDGVSLGANPFAEIVPCRIGPTVVLTKTSAFVEAVKYLLAPNNDPSLRVDVISMSMGGLASEAWADVVNQAYEAGVVLVTAAGNNFGVPKAIVYPARFHRVIAACGVMADGSPYVAGPGTMSGNFGPDSKMKTALATYTPNIPWAEVNARNIVDMNGCGTSAATPQIAGAAALWLQKYKARLNGQDGWKVVEAVRNALFQSAKKPAPEHFKHFGNGILQAFDALQVGPATDLVITPKDNASWEFFNLFEKPFGIAPVAGIQSPPERMLNLELTQLFQRDSRLEQIVPDPPLGLDDATRATLLQAVSESPFASQVLRNRCKRVLNQVPAGTTATATPQPSYPHNQEQAIPVLPPQMRRLRVYGFDPSLSTRLDSAGLNEVTIEIPWDTDVTHRKHLPLPGPVGEYIEVIDHDPATGCFYAPVDLNNPLLLASNGLAPSEGNPQFHQQMAYAVAMRTVQNFETALGRKAFWASSKEDGTGFVRRLRIYPHALREQNAYYHPGKKALLFGYFPATTFDPENILPGGIVFTCLSHDVVAHETTHALLDGMYRYFNHPSNPDLLAFHEAFADIVAIFQHFSLPGVLVARIAARGGNLRTDKLMGDLAQEFGRGAGLHASLRTALTGKFDKAAAIREVWEPHGRGAILLGAVFDAFVRIYEFRTRDLIRLASGGRDKLPRGPVNHDLAVRLAEEAGKSAQHVLNMCIRALDYCPPMDLTFGDYLRAVITADMELVPDDEKGYRIAFIEAFRARGIYPGGVRSMSADSLQWRRPNDPKHDLLDRLGLRARIRNFSDQFKRYYSRVVIFEQLVKVRRDFEKAMHALPPDDMRLFGLDPQLPFHLFSLRLSEKRGPYGRSVPQVIISVAQERQASLFENGTGPNILFEGGATIIIDPQYLRVNYVISKNILSKERLDLQRKYLQNSKQSLRDLYFSDDPNQRFAMLHRKPL